MPLSKIATVNDIVLIVSMQYSYGLIPSICIRLDPIQRKSYVSFSYGTLSGTIIGCEYYTVSQALYMSYLNLEIITNTI